MSTPTVVVESVTETAEMTVFLCRDRAHAERVLHDRAKDEVANLRDAGFVGAHAVVQQSGWSPASAEGPETWVYRVVDEDEMDDVSLGIRCYAPVVAR